MIVIVVSYGALCAAFYRYNGLPETVFDLHYKHETDGVVVVHCCDEVMMLRCCVVGVWGSLLRRHWSDYLYEFIILGWSLMMSVYCGKCYDVRWIFDRANAKLLNSFHLISIIIRMHLLELSLSFRLKLHAIKWCCGTVVCRLLGIQNSHITFGYFYKWTLRMISHVVAMVVLEMQSLFYNPTCFFSSFFLDEVVAPTLAK